MGMTLVLDNDCTVVNGSSYRFLVDINTDREIELLWIPPVDWLNEILRKYFL